METPITSELPLIEATEEEVALIKEKATKYRIDLRVPPKDLNARINHEHYDTLDDYHLRRTIMMLKCGILKAEKEAITSKMYGQQDANLQLAEYIQVLSKALKNNTEIKVSTVIKNIKEDTEIKGRNNLYLLWLHANTMLENQQDGTYQFRFQWKFKEQMKEEGYEQFKEPYTEEELETILKYETKTEREICENGKRNMTRLKKRAIDSFRKNGIFKDKTGELTSKEYQFLYDTLAVLGLYTIENMETLDPVGKKEALRGCARVRNK